MSRIARIGAAGGLLAMGLPIAGLAHGQTPDRVEELEQKVQNLEARVQALSGRQDEAQSDLDVTLDEMDEQILGLTRGIGNVQPGSRQFLMTGYASGGFMNAEGSDSTFFGSFVPIFLWKVNDRLFFEAETEFELEDAETHVALEYAQMSYILCENMTLGIGQFLNPANPFAERLHPAWINKLPDAPLAFGSQRIQPFTQLGIQLHGGVPVGDQKINYSVYVSNGPSLEEDAELFGKLEEDNFSDSNNNKAVGGRIGYFPMPELELGYAYEFSQATGSASDVASADVTIQSLDASYVRTVADGTLDLRGQWAFSDVDDVVFDPTGAGGFGPTSLNNKRDGGYVQAAYRLGGQSSEILNNFEGVLRYDEVDLPSGAPEGFDESRVTLGVNYWTGPSSVFKLAFRFDDASAPGSDADAILLQWAIGF